MTTEQRPIGIHPKTVSMKELTRLADEIRELRSAIDKLTIAIVEMNKNQDFIRVCNSQWNLPCGVSDLSLESLAESGDISKRTASLLNKSGIITLSDLSQMSMDEIASVHGIGKASLEEIKVLLRNKEG